MAKNKKLISHPSHSTFDEKPKKKLLALLIGGAISGAGMVQAASVLEEVIVTAQRRSQSVIDVPYNISVLSAESLQKSGVSSLNDLIRVVPGLFTVDSGPAQRGNNNQLTLRGIRLGAPPGGSEQNTPSAAVGSVSTYYGETPIFMPLMLRDLKRVEVLRGPQGTLYGSGSQAGTIRFIPNRPDFEGVEAEFNTSGGISLDAGSPNAAADGIINIPLSDELALRMNVAYERLGGFIDAPALFARQNPNDRRSTPLLSVAGDEYSSAALAPETSTNDSEQWQARVALRWQPTEQFDLEVSYVHQKTTVDDQQMANPNFTGPQTVDFGQGGGFPSVNTATTFNGNGDDTTHFNVIKQPFESDVDLGSVGATVDMGLASFSSVTSFSRVKTFGVTDFTPLYQSPLDATNFISFLSYYSFYPRHNSTQEVFAEERNFTQEVRLASSWDKPIDYVVGGYYNRQATDIEGTTYSPGMHAFTNFALADPANAANFFLVPLVNPQLPDVTSINLRSYDYEDKAIFGEVTWHITPEWQVTGGVRFFWQNFNLKSFEQVAQFTPTAFASRHNEKSSVSDQIFKGNISYEFAKDNRVYATYSEGFRRGGNNGLNTTGIFGSLPGLNTFRPDFSTNYEIGVKGIAADWAVRYNLAVYQIDIDDIQFGGTSGQGFSAIFNADKGRSKGVEFDMAWQANEQLTVTFAYNYMDAELSSDTEIIDFPLGGGGTTPVVVLALPDGTALPAVPEHTVSAGADYEIPVTGYGAGNWTMNFHLDGTYRDSSPGHPDPASVDFWTIPSTFVANFRITLDTQGPWSFDVYGTNITNDEGQSGASNYQFVTPFFGQNRYVSRPATFGAGVHYKFF